MKSQAKDVQQYLNEVPAERLEALQELRELCQATLLSYDESMEYGMPCYSKNGVVEVAFASQKNYISLYILKEHVLKKHRPSLQGLNLGKGCIRYSKPEKMDFNLVKGLLEETLHTDAEII